MALIKKRNSMKIIKAITLIVLFISSVKIMAQEVNDKKIFDEGKLRERVEKEFKKRNIPIEEIDAELNALKEKLRESQRLNEKLFDEIFKNNTAANNEKGKNSSVGSQSLTSDLCSVPVSERNALMAFFNAAGGPQWYNNTYWGSSIAVCNWYGVFVENGHVIGIRLDNNNLVGSIPPQITGLPYLRGLTLYQNHLTGPLPTELGQLTELRGVWLSGNPLNTIIPASLGLLTELTTLGLSSCDLTGSIPPELGQLDKLTSFDISFNELSGAIPNELINLNKLQSIRFQYNHLTGEIPSQLFSASPYLYSIYIGYNDLTGPLPLMYTNNIETLNLGPNKLSGAIPSSLVTMPKLKALILLGNNLEGTIPDFTNHTPTFTHFDIRQNKFRFIDFRDQFNAYMNWTHPTAGDAFLYSPQKKTDEEEIYYVHYGENVTLTMCEDNRFLPGDTFQWYKLKHVFLPSPTWVPEIIQGATQRTYVLQNFSIYDAGRYICISKRTNPAMTNNSTNPARNLSLERNIIRLDIYVPEPCYDCTSFDLLKNEKYLVSGWVKQMDPANPHAQYKNYDKGVIAVSFTDKFNVPIGTVQKFYPSGGIIDGWQRVIGEFTVPDNVDDIHLELLNESTDSKMVYFDDIRVFPSRGNMKSFVYDQKTQRLMAELDENNYSTFYEYDQEGGLIRVKKETEQGVFTIQETRSNNAKIAN